MSIVPRDRWCPVRATRTPQPIPLPAREVWLHHGAAGTSSVGTAVSYARYHIEQKGWGEVGYSFLIAAGTVLEGRGAGRQGAHTYGRNNISHGIVVCGDYRTREPSTEDLDAVVWLLQHGHDRGWWPAPELTGGHRDAPGASTSCPGDRLQRAIPTINRRAAENEDNMEWLKKWPEWARDVAKKYATKDTDPNKKVGDMTVAEWLAFSDRLFTRN